MKRLHRWLRLLERVPAYAWALVLVIAMLLVLAVVTRVGTIPGALEIDQAVVWEAGSPEAEAQSVTLPHVWHNERRDWEGRATYRLKLPPEALVESDSAGMGLLLPRVGVRYRVLLNGHEMEAGCWHHGHGYCDTGIHAQFVPLPIGLMSDRWSDNRIEIELQGQAMRISGLSPVWIGPHQAVSERYRWLDWWQIQLTWMVAASALMAGALAMLIWMRTPERLFGLFGAGLLVLTVRLWLSTPLYLPGPFVVWDYLHKLSFTWYCGLLYLFISELFEFRQDLVKRLVLAMMVVGPIWLVVLEWSRNYELYRWWTGVIVVVCVVALLAVIHRARWGMDVSQRLMVVVGVAVMVTGLRDFLVVQMGLPGDIDIRWMTPGSLVLMFAMGWVLVRRVSVAMEEVERLNIELSIKVDEREHEVQTLFERLRLVESQRVLEAERRRLTRDMHDGLGSQLVQALNVVRGGGQSVDRSAVAEMLNHALEDLRMTLDSLEPMDGDLPTILGTLRQRISPALQAAGVELDWDVQEVPTVPGLEARGVLHVFRCLQEVFANVLKHANASRVTVSTRDLGDQVELCVRDDGVGMGHAAGQGARGGGRGLGNIRLRAAELGVSVAFEDARPGTRVRFLFPLQKSSSVATA